MLEQSIRGNLYQFRCASISEPDQHHIIEVGRQGHILCSCRGESWCSHIDAVLLHGERAMVPADDHSIADAAQDALRGKIAPDPGWKANWKSAKRWRGIPLKKSKIAEMSRSAGLPLLSLEGRGKARREIERQAAELEWLVSPYPVKGCIFHIAPTATETAASTRAQALSIPVLSFDDWREVAEELTVSLLRRISDHMKGDRQL